MVEPNILYEQLADYDSKEDIERTLIRLLHESFDDEYITVSYFGTSDIYFEHEWVDAGMFDIDGYVVEKAGMNSYRVRLSASYEELLPRDCDDERGEEIDFFDTIDGQVIYKLTVQCGRDLHTGQGRIVVVPKI